MADHGASSLSLLPHIGEVFVTPLLFLPSFPGTNSLSRFATRESWHSFQMTSIQSRNRPFQLRKICTPKKKKKDPCLESALVAHPTIAFGPPANIFSIVLLKVRKRGDSFCQTYLSLGFCGAFFSRCQSVGSLCSRQRCAYTHTRLRLHTCNVSLQGGRRRLLFFFFRETGWWW